MRRTQVELGERVDEIAEDLELRAPQRIADVLSERPELAGVAGRDHVRFLCRRPLAHRAPLRGRPA